MSINGDRRGMADACTGVVGSAVSGSVTVWLHDEGTLSIITESWSSDEDRGLVYLYQNTKKVS